ncbi:MAG: hypothetical protein ACREQJ_08225, partial [Candidatus Binatia bacterium]
ARVVYAQPDFRAPAEIDATGARPVPLTLVVRRVGRETEEQITGAEVRSLVEALCAMFEIHTRPADMAPVRHLAAGLPKDDETVSLVVPTQ